MYGDFVEVLNAYDKRMTLKKLCYSVEGNLLPVNSMAQVDTTYTFSSGMSVFGHYGFLLRPGSKSSSI